MPCSEQGCNIRFKPTIGAAYGHIIGHHSKQKGVKDLKCRKQNEHACNATICVRALVEAYVQRQLEESPSKKSKREVSAEEPQKRQVLDDNEAKVPHASHTHIRHIRINV